MDIVAPSDLEKIHITVIGAGGIGSPTTLALSKMGVENITIYDDDKVEKHNLPNQMFRISDLGKSKVEGTRDICKDFAGVDIEIFLQKFETQTANGIVISGVDSMKSRKDIWAKMKFNPAVKLYIDARMGAEVCRILTVKTCDPDDVRWYEKTLFSDDKASVEKCTEKAIIYNTFTISGLVANQVKKFARMESFPREIIFDLKTLMFITNYD